MRRLILMAGVIHAGRNSRVGARHQQPFHEAGNQSFQLRPDRDRQGGQSLRRLLPLRLRKLAEEQPDPGRSVELGTLQ